MIATILILFSYFSELLWSGIALFNLKKVPLPFIFILLDALLALVVEIIGLSLKLNENSNWIGYLALTWSEFVWINLYYLYSIDKFKKNILFPIIVLFGSIVYGYYLWLYRFNTNSNALLNVIPMYWILVLTFIQWGAILNRKQNNVLFGNLYFWTSLIIAISTVGNYLFWIGNNFFEKDKTIIEIIRIAYPSMNIFTNLGFALIFIYRKNCTTAHG